MFFVTLWQNQNNPLPFEIFSDQAQLRSICHLIERLRAQDLAFEPLMIRRSCAWSRLRSDPVALEAVYDHTQPQLNPVLIELKSACALELPCNFERKMVSCQLELILSVQFCARLCIYQIIMYFQHMNAPSSSWPSCWQKDLSENNCNGFLNNSLTTNSSNSKTKSCVRELLEYFFESTGTSNPLNRCYLLNVFLPST